MKKIRDTSPVWEIKMIKLDDNRIWWRAELYKDVTFFNDGFVSYFYVRNPLTEEDKRYIRKWHDKTSCPVDVIEQFIEKYTEKPEVVEDASPVWEIKMVEPDYNGIWWRAEFFNDGFVNYLNVRNPLTKEDKRYIRRWHDYNGCPVDVIEEFIEKYSEKEVVKKSLTTKPQVYSERVENYRGKYWKIRTQKSYGTIEISNKPYRWDVLWVEPRNWKNDSEFIVEAERIFKEQKEHDIYVKRLEKYERIMNFVRNERHNWQPSDKDCLDIIKINLEGFQHNEFNLFFSHLIELLWDVRNQNKIDEYLIDRLAIEPNSEREYRQLIMHNWDAYYPLDNYIKYDIKDIAQHLKVPELEVICDLILACQESEGK